jgi:hypothetical protein
MSGPEGETVALAPTVDRTRWRVELLDTISSRRVQLLLPIRPLRVPHSTNDGFLAKATSHRGRCPTVSGRQLVRHGEPSPS